MPDRPLFFDRLFATVQAHYPGATRQHLCEHLAGLSEIGDTGWVLEEPLEQVAAVLAEALRKEEDRRWQ